MSIHGDLARTAQAHLNGDTASGLALDHAIGKLRVLKLAVEVGDARGDDFDAIADAIGRVAAAAAKVHAELAESIADGERMLW